MPFTKHAREGKQRPRKEAIIHVSFTRRWEAILRRSLNFYLYIPWVTSWWVAFF